MSAPTPPTGAPIRTLLVANRGEIARRIMATCRRMGIATVAVYSEADADASFVHEADMAVAIGGAAPSDSYLRVDRIVDAARRTGADAVHPGYGFLSERAELARAVTDAGLVFVGPTAEAIEAMGSKIEAKRRMEAAGVPVLASATIDTPIDAPLDVDAVRGSGEAIGAPVLVKASAGGGGRGMRVVDDLDALADAVDSARREAASAFGDGTVYLERYVAPSRHVEVQILGDHTGRVVHLHERECSIQRRHQKIIEEAPCPSIDDDTRRALHDAAVRAGEAIGYRNAGTVEFLVGPDGAFHFLEVNTRLQVEHPVTEAVLGIDLVALQLEVAAGAPAPDQAGIGDPSGHAIEARIYAEDPTRDFAPSTGEVHRFAVPDGVRVDAALDDHGTVTPHYDAMIAKVVAHAPDRTTAARRLARALRGTEIGGIDHNLALLVRTLESDAFLRADADSGFIEAHGAATLGAPLVDGAARDAGLVALALARQAANRAEARHLRGLPSGFRNVPTADQELALIVGEDAVTVTYRFDGGTLRAAAVDGASVEDPVLHGATPDHVDLTVGGIRRRYALHRAGDDVLVVTAAGSVRARIVPRFAEPEDLVEEGSLVATMPGTVRSVAVAVGDAVRAGDTILVLEAMKMELSVNATVDGTVSEIDVAPGDAVEVGAVLAVVDPAE